MLRSCGGWMFEKGKKKKKARKKKHTKQMKKQLQQSVCELYITFVLFV